MSLTNGYSSCRVLVSVERHHGYTSDTNTRESHPERPGTDRGREDNSLLEKTTLPPSLRRVEIPSSFFSKEDPLPTFVSSRRRPFVIRRGDGRDEDTNIMCLNRVERSPTTSSTYYSYIPCFRLVNDVGTSVTLLLFHCNIVEIRLYKVLDTLYVFNELCSFDNFK